MFNERFLETFLADVKEMLAWTDGDPALAIDSNDASNARPVVWLSFRQAPVSQLFGPRRAICILRTSAETMSVFPTRFGDRITGVPCANDTMQQRLDEIACWENLEIGKRAPWVA